MFRVKNNNNGPVKTRPLHGLVEVMAVSAAFTPNQNNEMDIDIDAARAADLITPHQGHRNPVTHLPL